MAYSKQFRQIKNLFKEIIYNVSIGKKIFLF